MFISMFMIVIIIISSSIDMNIYISNKHDISLSELYMVMLL